jgi:hypothetical protein
MTWASMCLVYAVHLIQKGWHPAKQVESRLQARLQMRGHASGVAGRRLVCRMRKTGDQSFLPAWVSLELPLLERNVRLSNPWRWAGARVGVRPVGSSWRGRLVPFADLRRRPVVHPAKRCRLGSVAGIAWWRE